MELIVRRGSEEIRFTVERRGGVFQVGLGERVLGVERAVAGEGLRSLLIGGRQHELSIVALGEGRYRVTSSAGEHVVEVLDPLAHLARRRRTGPDTTGPERIAAYMPGRVVALLVRPGDRVASGQGVIVLEAMKMQNEIAAPRDAVVTAFHVAAGQAVEAGDPLVDLE